MKNKLPILIVFLLLFISILTIVNATPTEDLPHTDPGEYAITLDGKYAYINDDNAFIMAPAELHGSGWTYLNFTAKQYTGPIDLALGFDTTHLKPKKAEFYNPHVVEWNTNHEQVFFNVIIHNNYSGEPLDYGNSYNTHQRIIDHDIFTYDDNLNINGTIRISSNISFNSYDNIEGNNYTIYWHTEHSRIENYVDITNKFSVLPESLHNDYDGKNKWYYVKEQPISAGVEYQIRILVDAPPQVGEHSYKYDVVIKPSGHTFGSSTTYILDPYWNTSFSNREQITITTNGTSTPADYQVKLNISYESEMQADFDDIRFTNASDSEIAYWIESKVDSNYANIWVNLSDAITDPGSDIIWMYYGNPGLSDGGVGTDTFVQYHGSATANYNDTTTFLSNIIYESYIKMTDISHNILLGTSDEAGASGDAFQIQTYTQNDLRYFYSKNDGTQTQISEAPDFIVNTYVRVKLTFDGTNAHAYVDGNEIST
ncbi:DUF2341 domain-containing protein, partial [archaeon]|nr:DUF2341 domain-containing protein [archaeon]